jgi:hypothetical protein
MFDPRTARVFSPPTSGVNRPVRPVSRILGLADPAFQVARHSQQLSLATNKSNGIRSLSTVAQGRHKFDYLLVIQMSAWKRRSRLVPGGLNVSFKCRSG